MRKQDCLTKVKQPVEAKLGCKPCLSACRIYHVDHCPGEQVDHLTHRVAETVCGQRTVREKMYFKKTEKGLNQIE